MQLPELLEQLERQASDAERIGAIAPVDRTLRAVIADLAQLHGNGSELPQERDDNQPDVMLKVGEAAQRLGLSRRWLYDHHPALPFAKKIGRAVRFSERGLERWLARQRR